MGAIVIIIGALLLYRAHSSQASPRSTGDSGDDVLQSLEIIETRVEEPIRIELPPPRPGVNSGSAGCPGECDNYGTNCQCMSPAKVMVAIPANEVPKTRSYTEVDIRAWLKAGQLTAQEAQVLSLELQGIYSNPVALQSAKLKLVKLL